MLLGHTFRSNLRQSRRKQTVLESKLAGVLSLAEGLFTREEAFGCYKGKPSGNIDPSGPKTLCLSVSSTHILEYLNCFLTKLFFHLSEHNA